MLRKQNNTARKHSVWETNLQPRTQTACFLLTCCRGPWVTVRTAQFGCRPKLNNMQHREHYMSSYMKGVLAAWSAATGRLHRRAGRGSGSEIHPLNARCVVLGAGAEATRTPDAFVLAATQSFSPQLSGFLSLLLLKRCFEIRLPFEVSQVQHDIYLRYTPNCFLSRSHPLSPETCFLHFRRAPHASHARGAPEWCPPLPKKKKIGFAPSLSPDHGLAWQELAARGRLPGTPPPRRADTPARPEDPVWWGGSGGRRPWCAEAGCWLTQAALSRNPAACQSPLASDRGLAPVQTLACKQAGRLPLWSIS